MHLPADLQNHPLTDVANQAVHLCSRNEGIRADATMTWVLPANQGLHRTGKVGDHVVDGLIFEDEFLVGQGMAQLDLEVVATHGILAHGRFEEAQRFPARRLGLIHGKVGILE